MSRVGAGVRFRVLLASVSRDGRDWVLTLACGHTVTRPLRRKRLGRLRWIAPPPVQVECGSCWAARVLR